MSLPSSMADFVPCDRLLQKAYSHTKKQNKMAVIRPFARFRSHGTKSQMLVSKLRSGTSKTKAGPGGLVRVELFWKSHCATCSPACAICIM